MSILQKKSDQFKKIIKQTEIRFGRGSSVNWRNKDFEDLSFEINQKAKILISAATLKRIFGKVKTSAYYSPQESTVKALIIYSGYTETINPSLGKKRKIKYLYFLAFIPALIWLILHFTKEESNPIGECTLGLVKIEGQGPSSAYFNYSIPDSKDSIFINFGDNPDWLHTSGLDKTISHFYGYPGYFNADIRTRKRALTKQVKVFVPTTGWKALAYYFNPDLVERYFPVPFKENTSDGIFHATRKNLASLGIDSTEIVIVRLDNYQKTGKSGDSFILNSKFKNSSFWPAIRCFSVHYTIQGTNGTIRIKFVGEGCSNVSDYTIGDKNAHGGRTDLSCFVVDLHEWSDIEIRNTNKNVTVSIADSVVFDDTYIRSLGEIIGTTIMFHGSGSVDYIELTDSLNNSIFEEYFL